jgi:hypothetical protein
MTEVRVSAPYNFSWQIIQSYFASDFESEEKRFRGFMHRRGPAFPVFFAWIFARFLPYNT